MERDLQKPALGFASSAKELLFLVYCRIATI